MSSSNNCSPAPLLTPSLKDYKFSHKIGSGTYATVYKAYKKIGNEAVAIKCIKKRSLNAVSSENLLTEIELLKRLKHTHIVELKDFQWDQHYIYLIMEYCAFGDLSDFIRSHHILPELAARLFMQQIALAFQYLRSENVSHLDLKPSNILLSSSSHLKIADFGFAQYLDEDTSANQLIGSPLYMAPEILLKRHYDDKADLWSIGVILYECLFGRAPFYSKSFSELKEKIQSSQPVFIPASLQGPCRDLLERLLVRDPSDRLTTEQFVNHHFIDLKHMPQEDSLSNAIELVSKAVKLDSENKYHEAIELYSESLRYFLSAIYYEKSETKKELLRNKVTEYMKRAETLKRLPTSHASTDKPLELDDLEIEDEMTLAAIKVARSAELREYNGDLTGALQEYELCVETLIKTIKDLQSNSLLRKKLREFTSQILSRAEHLKEQVNSKPSTSLVKEEVDKSILSQQCVIQ